MKEVKIVLNKINTANEEILMSYLAKELSLSEHFGRNLDALWDELRGYNASIIIEWSDYSSGLKSLGAQYARALRELFEALPEENPKTRVIIHL